MTHPFYLISTLLLFSVLYGCEEDQRNSATLFNIYRNDIIYPRPTEASAAEFGNFVILQPVEDNILRGWIVDGNTINFEDHAELCFGSAAPDDLSRCRLYSQISDKFRAGQVAVFDTEVLQLPTPVHDDCAYVEFTFDISKEKLRTPTKCLSF